jgi:hypothetical protein
MHDLVELRSTGFEEFALPNIIDFVFISLAMEQWKP